MREVYMKSREMKGKGGLRDLEIDADRGTVWGDEKLGEIWIPRTYRLQYHLRKDRCPQLPRLPSHKLHTPGTSPRHCH